MAYVNGSRSWKLGIAERINVLRVQLPARRLGVVSPTPVLSWSRLDPFLLFVHRFVGNRHRPFREKYLHRSKLNF